MERASLNSDSVAVLEQRNKELEQLLAKLKLEKAAAGRSSQPRGVSSASVEILRHNLQLQDQVARMAKLTIKEYKASEAAPKLPTISSEESVRFVGSEHLLLMDDKIRHLELRGMLQKAQELDLAFLVDSTISMGAWLDKVKDLTPKIANDVKKAFPKLKLRMAFVPYRDYADSNQDEAEKCDFTDSFNGPKSVFVSAIAKVKVSGGGDLCEDVFSGLERLATLSWRSKTRVLIHIADAPCHGNEFHDGVQDDYPNGDSKGRDISKLLAALRHGCQILNYLFCHVTDQTKKMLRVFRERAPQGGWIQEEKLDNISNLLEVVVSASCGSIAVSSRIVSAGPSVPKYLPVPWKNEIPDWKDIEWQKGVQFSYKLPATLEDLFKIVDNNGSLVRERKPPSIVKIAKRPFTDEGNMRWPYHALLDGENSKPQRKMVVKRFKEPVGEHASKVHTMEAYCEQMEVQTVAAFLAEHFNQDLEKLSGLTGYKTVQFTAVSVLRVGDSTYYNLEMWLEGRWIRYSNNVNYVNTKEYADTLHAFSHWTYQRSNGLLMVTDLQGVQVEGSGGKNVFMLCDPAIHCKHVSRYELTNTNWSTPGMDSFFETHLCNSICRSLNLKPKS